MYAIAVLAFTLPPSIAFVIDVFVRLQSERDRKITDTHITALHKNCNDIDTLVAQVTVLTHRLAEAEQHIGQLTDRSLR